MVLILISLLGLATFPALLFEKIDYDKVPEYIKKTLHLDDSEQIKCQIQEKSYHALDDLCKEMVDVAINNCNTATSLQVCSGLLACDKATQELLKRPLVNEKSIRLYTKDICKLFLTMFDVDDASKNYPKLNKAVEICCGITMIQLLLKPFAEFSCVHDLKNVGIYTHALAQEVITHMEIVLAKVPGEEQKTIHACIPEDKQKFEKALIECLLFIYTLYSTLDLAKVEINSILDEYLSKRIDTLEKTLKDIKG